MVIWLIPWSACLLITAWSIQLIDRINWSRNLVPGYVFHHNPWVIIGQSHYLCMVWFDPSWFRNKYLNYWKFVLFFWVSTINKESVRKKSLNCFTILRGSETIGFEDEFANLRQNYSAFCLGLTVVIRRFMNKLLIILIWFEWFLGLMIRKYKGFIT